MSIKIKSAVSIAISLALSTSALANSTFDVATGVLAAPCVEIETNGAPGGEAGSRLVYSIDFSLNGGLLAAGNAVEVTPEGNCTASFETTTGVYTDLVAVGADQVELRLAYNGGIDFVPLSVFIQRDFNEDDLTLAVGSSKSLSLASGIDSSAATIAIANDNSAPGFVSIVGNELQLDPQAGDEGEYNLRIEWADQVEHINVNVTSSLDNIVSLSQQPTNLPSFSDLNLYSSNSVFNTPLPDNPEIDPNSEIFLEGLIRSEQFVVQVGQFSSTVFFADNQTDTTNINLPCGEFWELGISEITNVPIPQWSTPANDVDGGEEPPIGCGEESAQDNFMILLDLENRCEYDLWQAREEDGQWIASFATAFNMDGPGVHPNGLSSRGSGFAFLGGVIWPSELQEGTINHPLSFSYEFPKANGPVAPATDSDGVSEEAFALPEGARIQLDPEFNLDSLNLTDYERTIAEAMQTYGLLLVDRGGVGPAGLYAVDPASSTSNSYSSVWGEEDFVALSNLDISQLPFRVLKLPEQDTDWRDTLALADNQCANYQ